ncbi:hypothetical protein L1049_025881 [Liquidambar formosana]|uniref:Protein OSB1, mitochondrial n=1 Tax=Liquidambar formosana TaxID=63359 RepID=A0AAP0NCC0_LIQFO
MKVSRFRALLSNATPFSLQKFIPFSSASAANPRPSNFFSGDSEGGSAVYRHTLKFQRPTTMKWRKNFFNSVSFIGSVDRPLEVQARRTDGRLGVYTLLSVQTSRDSNRTFRILLQMLDEMAKMSLKHLKPDDFIYVSGQLQCYTKTDLNGKLRTYYKVIVNELNYVAQHGQGSTSKKFEKSDSGGGGTGLEKYKSRLHLWQLFFANPYEWWDNRKRKSNPKLPDFRHKDTDEALWINPDDPPWIKRQLQLHDLRIAGQGLGEHVSSRSRVSTWVYDHYE